MVLVHVRHFNRILTLTGMKIESYNVHVFFRSITICFLELNKLCPDPKVPYKTQQIVYNMQPYIRQIMSLCETGNSVLWHSTEGLN